MAQSKKPWGFGSLALSDASQHPAWAMFERVALLKLHDGKETRRLEFEGSDCDQRLGINVFFKAAL